MKLGALYIFILLFMDQITKHLAKAFIALSDPDIIWIPHVLQLAYRENRGASGSMLQNQQFLFMIVTIIALAMFGYLFLEVDFKKKKTYSWSVILFIAGTLGNAIDRALLGYVIDFLHYPFLDIILDLFNLSNFYNNFADLYLSLGIVLFAVDLFFFEGKRKKETTHDHVQRTE
jgi:signal peptidase II